MTPINYPTLLPDSDGNGEIVSSGKIAVLGKKGQVWLYKGQNANGTYLYWPKGYEAPVEPTPPAEPTPPPAPVYKPFDALDIKAPTIVEGRVRTNSMEFKTSASNKSWDQGQTVTGKSAVYKLKDKAVVLDGITFADMQLNDVGTLFRGYSGTNKNMVIENIDMKCRYFAGVGASIYQSDSVAIENLTIRNVRYVGVTPITSAGDIYAPITLAGKASDDVGKGFLFENLEISECWTEYTGSSVGHYANRDGIAVEHGYTDGLIHKVRIKNGSDAGIDMKGINWRIHDAVIENFRENLKLWTGGNHGHIKLVNPRFAGAVICPEGVNSNSVFNFEHLALEWTNVKTPVFYFQRSPSEVFVKSADTSKLPKGFVWGKAEGKAKGKCKIHLPDGTTLTV